MSINSSYLDVVFSGQDWLYAEPQRDDSSNDPIPQAKAEKIAPVQELPQFNWNQVQAESELLAPNYWRERLEKVQNHGPIKFLFVNQVFSTELESGVDITFQDLAAIFESDTLSLFNKMISAMKLKPTDFAVSAINTTEEKNQNYLPILIKEIALLRPEFVISLGAYSTKILGETQERISKIHGKRIEIPALQAIGMKTPMVPIFHPDFLMINPNMKRAAWNDMQKLMGEVGIA